MRTIANKAKNAFFNGKSLKKAKIVKKVIALTGIDDYYI